jgi:hypothetical protein
MTSFGPAFTGVRVGHGFWVDGFGGAAGVWANTEVAVSAESTRLWKAALESIL